MSSKPWATSLPTRLLSGEVDSHTDRKIGPILFFFFSFNSLTLTADTEGNKYFTVLTSKEAVISMELLTYICKMFDLDAIPKLSKVWWKLLQGSCHECPHDVVSCPPLEIYQGSETEILHSVEILERANATKSQTYSSLHKLSNVNL